MTNYYRTSKGDARHADRECANQRRAIDSAVIELTDAEAAEMAPCEHCTSPAEQAAAEQAAAKQAETRCPNPGVTHPKRIQSNCRACGKPGKVNRRTGKIAAH